MNDDVPGVTQAYFFEVLPMVTFETNIFVCHLWHHCFTSSINGVQIYNFSFGNFLLK